MISIQMPSSNNPFIYLYHACTLPLQHIVYFTKLLIDYYISYHSFGSVDNHILRNQLIWSQYVPSFHCILVEFVEDFSHVVQVCHIAKTILPGVARCCMKQLGYRSVYIVTLTSWRNLWLLYAFESKHSISLHYCVWMQTTWLVGYGLPCTKTFEYKNYQFLEDYSFINPNQNIHTS